MPKDSGFRFTVLRFWRLQIPIRFLVNLWIFIFTFTVFFGGIVFFSTQMRIEDRSTGIGGYLYIGWLVSTVLLLVHLLLSRLVFNRNPKWIRSILEDFRR